MHLRELMIIADLALAASAATSLAAFFARPKLPNLMDEIAAWSARVGWVFLTFFELGRWLAWKDHPPLASPYEAIGFFAWSVMTMHVYFDFRQRVRIQSTLVPGLAVLLSLAAWTTPEKGIPPLPPAFKSALLFIHPPAGILAFGAFTLAAAFGVLLLFKERVRTEVLLFAVSVIGACLLPLAGGRDFYGSQLALACGWAAFGGFAAHVFLSALWLLFPFPEGKASHSKFFASAGEKIQWGQLVLRVLFSLSLVLLLLSVLGLLPVIGAAPHRQEGGHGILYGATTILGFAGLAVFLSLPMRWRPQIEARLPGAAVLDRCGHQAMIVGFLSTGLCLFLGMLWAFLVWGQYWNWDNKEIWTLALWIYSGIYLYSRQRLPIEKRTLAIMACGGFLVMLFAFLGVNLLMTTRHAFPGFPAG